MQGAAARSSVISTSPAVSCMVAVAVPAFFTSVVDGGSTTLAGLPSVGYSHPTACTTSSPTADWLASPHPAISSSEQAARGTKGIFFTGTSFP